MYFSKTFETRNELLSLLEGLSEEGLHQKEKDGHWSVSENVEHLYLMENKVVQNMKKAIDEKQMIEGQEISLEKIITNRTFKVDAPQDLIPSGRFYTKKELIQMIGQSRMKLKTFIKEVENEPINILGCQHRRFGSLSILQWVQLIGYHERRHIEQIKEAIGRRVK